MKTYQFFVDQKVQTWMRTEFSIEAATQEEAEEKARDFVRNEEHELLSWQAATDSIEVIPEVWEIYSKDGNFIEAGIV
jgi:hypothetical protein